MNKKLTGEDPTPRQFVESLLPKHYDVTEMITGCIWCRTSGNGEGIEDESEWNKIMDSIRGYFGESFKEVYHTTCTNHLRFSVYYDYHHLNNIDHNHQLIKK